MIQVFIFCILGILKVTSSCTWDQTYWKDASISVKQQQLSFTDVSTLKLGLGFWISYQPLNGVKFAQNLEANYHSDITKMFLFALKQKYSDEYILYNYVEMIPDQYIIQHVTLISTEYQWLTDTTVMNNQYYEGNWILIYFFIDQTAQNVKIQYYFPTQSSLIQSTLNGQLKVDQNMMTTTGSYLNIQLPQQIYLQSFTGLILAVFNTDYNIFDNIQQYLKACPIQVTCTSLNQPLIQSNIALTGTQFISRQSLYFIAKNRYLLQGWIKQNALFKETQLISLLLRITTNKLYLDETQAGDRVLYILYYQNQIQEQLNGFSIQTYGYTFPYKPSLYSTDQSDIINVRGVQYQDLLTQWHYFQFEIGTQTNQGQPIYLVEFPTQNLKMNLNWSKPKNQFSNTNLYFSIGGDNYFSNNFKGYISNWNFKYFCNSVSPSFQLLCHYSCLTCQGITSSDCLSCGDDRNRIFSATENICYCQIGYYDVDGQPVCQQFTEINSIIQIQEKEINCKKEGFYQCDPQICQFGYFPYKNDCVKCPFYDSLNKETIIECANCYIYPEYFSQNLTCTFKFNSSNTQSVYFYYLGLPSESFQIYSIFKNVDKKYELKLEKGVYDINMCLKGYYLDDFGECKQCMRGCRMCLKYNTCGECFDDYGLTEVGQCKLCQVCLFCQFQNYTEYCPQKFKLSCQQNQYYENKYCYDCGNNCQLCPNKYCQSCIDEPKYFISMDNFNCLKCTIPNCKYCFQYYNLNDGTLITTLNFRSTYNQTQYVVKTGCAQCEENFFFSFITLQCIQVAQSDCQYGVINKQGTSICLKSQTQSDAVQQNSCSNKFCKSCINNYSYQIESFCIICMDGFYSAYLTGQCLQCPSNCKTCAEQDSGQKDNWKWEIRAFYQYLQNQDGYHPFEQYNTDSSDNYQVVCLSCYSSQILYQGYCQQGCGEDCLDCRVIVDVAQDIFQVKCFKCKSSAYSLQRSTDPKKIQNCLPCPNFCTACYPRTSQEITQINPFFSQKTDLLKYTHICYKTEDSNKEGYVSLIPKLLVPHVCMQSEKCEKSIQFTYYVYCDSIFAYFERLMEPDINLQDRYTSIEAIFEFGYTSDISYLQDTLNQQRITEATYNFEFRYMEDYQICFFTVTPTFISSIVQETIFSVQQTNLIFYNIFPLKTPFMVQGNVFIQNYGLVKFQNISFIMPSNPWDDFQATILFLNDYYFIQILLEDCEFIKPDHQEQVSLTFYSDKPQNLTLNNIRFDGVIIKNSVIFDVAQATKISKSKISVQFLTINNSNFTNTCLFNFSAKLNSLNYEINITNVTIMNSFFIESQFINSSFENQNQIGSLYLQNFHLSNIQFSNYSIFLNILSVENIIMKNFTLNNLVFQDTSSFLISNVINIDTLIFINSQINMGYFVTNQIKQQLPENVKVNSKITILKNLTFKNNSYLNELSFIYLLQDYVDDLSVNLQNLYLDDNNYQNSNLGIQSFNYLSYKNSLIYIECTQCNMYNITILRGIGLPEISIVKSNYLKIVNLQIHLKDKYYFRSLHQSFECVKQFIQFDTSFVMYIEQYKEIEIKNLILHDSVIVDYPFIQIAGTRLTEVIQNDIITITDSVFSNNVLIVTEPNKISSIIFITTQQETIIEIKNVSFVNNIMNVYYEDIKLHASSTLLLDAQSSDIKIESSQFLQNVITNTSDGILFIKTENLTILNCSFLNSNNFTTEALAQIIILPISYKQFYEGTLTYFPILSEGGNGNLFVSNLQIVNTTIINSTAINGGGFFITSQDDGNIFIKNSFFENVVTILNGNQISSGGTLYIDSSKSKLNLSIINSTIHKSYSRTMGGAIFIEPSRLDNQIHLHNMTIMEAFSLQHSILSYSPSKLISATSNIIIENTIIQNSKNEFEQFASLLSGLSQQNIEPFQKNNPHIFIQFSNFTMRNCTFQNIHLANLIQIEQGIFIQLFQVNILNCTILKTSIFTFSLRQSINGIIVLENIVIHRVSQFNYIQTSDYCVTNEITPLDMMCPLFSNEIAEEIIIDSTQFNLASSIQCTLNQLYNATDTNFSLIQIMNMEVSHYLSTLGVVLSEIQCVKCYFGLFSIQQFNFTSLSLRLFSLTFIDNYCGYLGCVTIFRQTDDVTKEQVQETVTNTIVPTINSTSLEPINETSTIDLENTVSSEIFQAQFDNCLFMNNSASYGGACYIQNINLLINNSYFIQNKAQLKGGAIYYESSHHQIRIINSEIVNNYAEIAGGVYINDIQFQKTKQLNLFLKDNFATKYSNNLKEAPRKLFISLDKITRFNNINFITDSTAIIDQVIIEPYQTVGLQNKTDILLLPSGTSISKYVYFDYNKNIYIPYNLSFRIQAYNMLDEQIKGLDDTYCNLEAYIMNKSEQIYQNGDNSSKLISQTIVTFNTDTGDYNLDDLIIKFNPYSDQDLYLQLAINCNSVQVPYYKSPDDTDSISIITNYKLLLNMRTFQCQLGEYFNDNQTYCTLCDIQQNQFSVTLNATKCNQKDEIKMSEIKSAMINLRKSYWRAFYYSENIELCYHQQANCQGGWLSGNPSCARGHIGALCEQCDLYDVKGEGSFSQSQQYQCSNCKQVAGNLLNIICVVIWTLFSVFVSVNSTNQMIENFIFELKLKPFGYLAILKSASTSVLLKVFTNYLQIISSIASFQLQIPLGITLAFRGVGNPVESMAFSLDCYLIHASNISIIYFRIIWGFIMAGIYIFLFLLFHLTMVLFKKVKINITFLMTTLIYIYIYLSPNLFSGLIALLSYRDISSEKWISANIAYLYETDSHRKWLLIFVVPALTTIGVLLPFFFWFILFSHRSKLNETRIRKFWGYLYNEYKLVTYYWETVKIIQKELIILVMIYYEDYVPIKAALIFFILYLYNHLTSNCKPYLAGNLNRIDQLSTTICQISIILAQSIYLAQSLNIDEIVFPFYAILTIINLLFTFQMISDILFAYFDKLYEQTDKIKQYIFSKLPKIAQQNTYCQKLFQNTTPRKQLIRRRFQKIRQYLVKHAKNIIHYKKSNEYQLRNENTHLQTLSSYQFSIGSHLRQFNFQNSNAN